MLKHNVVMPALAVEANPIMGRVAVRKARAVDLKSRIAHAV